MTTKTFSDLDLHDQLVQRLADQGITEPFPIQELAIPMALKGADVIGQARTGTGKTLAFGLPLLHRIDPEIAQTQAFVVVPTRELCLQVADDLSVGEDLGIRVTAIYGGVGYEDQNRELTTGVHVVVGTPGRLLDQLNRGNLDLSNVRELVLDEADEMLDMGFLPDVERLIEACPGDRHTMLFSATMPTAVVKLARRYMSHPTFLRADTEEHEVAPTVDQHFFLVHRMDKPRLLARILQQPERGAVYVFTRTKAMADRLVNELEQLNTRAIAIHGDLRQSTRERNMDRFRDGNVDVLVATEVAARGLDVENATHVVNYDCPDDHKMYLHRIGRTARAGASGVAITFAEFNEVDRLNVIRKAVDADREIEEVFSTSDEITERFDLPERTPWDHLASSSGNGGGGSSRGERKGGERSRKPKTDGRPKNRRSSEGKGDRDASRSRQRASGGSSAEKSPDSRSKSQPRTRDPRERAKKIIATKDDRAERVRTRSRSVSKDEPKTGGSEETPRKRERATPAKASSDPASGSGSQRSSDDRRSRSQGRRSSSGGSKAQTRDRAKGESRGERHPDRPWLEPTSSGDEARGEGQPQLSRRVKVEHLP